MKLADLSTGPDWVAYVGFVIMQDNGNWNVCYSNSYIDYGAV